jgi:uncharacterized protein YydD (DUF2326 family)
LLRSLSSTLDSFKPAIFEPGLNIVVATRTVKAAKKDSRNAVGKSSLVAILDFLLAGDANSKHLTRRPELQDEYFELVLELEDTDHRIQRSGASQDRPFFDGSPIPLGQLREILGRQMFGVTGAPHEPSYRALVAFYLRDRESGGFMDPLRTFSRQTDLSAYPALTYLLGLDGAVVGRALEIANSKKNLAALRNAAKDPIFGRVVGSAAELDAEISTLTVTLQSIQERLASFEVVEDYEVRRAEADLLSRRIRALNDRAALLEQRRNDLLVALDGEVPASPEYAYLVAVYEEVGISLPESATRPFDEVEAFHASVVRNRRAYLEAELVEVAEHVQRIAVDMATLDKARADVMVILQEGGALETFTALQRNAAEIEGSLSALRERRASVEALTNATKHLRAKGVELEEATNLVLAERSDHIDAISKMYTELAFEIYGKDRPAALSVTSSPKGYVLHPTLGGEKSAGISSMALFCFDLTMAVTAHRAGRGPDFIVHDSHLYDSVEERQIGAALRVASQICNDEGMQYVATLNSDVLESALRYEPQLVYTTPVTLTDAYETGGLFGTRFN